MPEPQTDQITEQQTECEKPVKQPTWAEDQKDHAYYYDDAHGYETFDPEADDDEDDD